MEYRDAGSGPALLYVHGAGGSADQAKSIDAPFLAGGFRVISMSRFGYSRTCAPMKPTLALQAEAYHFLLNALGVRRASVIAVSAGVPSALEFALRHACSCAGLILIVPTLYRHITLAPSGQRPLERLLLGQLLRVRILVRLVRKVIPYTLVRAIFGTPADVVAAATPAVRAQVFALLDALGGAGEMQGGLTLDSALTVCPDLARFATISTPALAISAEDDLYCTAEAVRMLTKVLRQMEWVIFQCGGHLLIGHEAEVQCRIMDFVCAQAGGGPGF